MDRFVARTVDEVHRPLAFQRGVQHGQRGCDADAAADQHHRPVAGSQHKLAGGREHIEPIAFL
ncbi:hypothetical protein [Polaromonas sp.]|uniref:hypothetical protein n=1 Tax=Polaromonas sp. TaxID=1869339 RepID=UPI003524794A